MKIKKAIIIRRPKHELSQQYAQVCIDSCDEHNLPYEILPAIEYLPAKEAFAAAGVKTINNFNNGMGNACSNASHILCWRRIIELNEPLLILEHDAVVVGNVTTVDIPDNVIVIFGNYVNDKDEYKPIGPIERLVEVGRSVGLHAYTMSPVTAKKLIDKLEKEGINWGIDRTMMHRARLYPLYLADPPQVVCWVRLSTASGPKGMGGRNPGWCISPREVNIKSWFAGLKNPEKYRR